MKIIINFLIDTAREREGGGKRVEKFLVTAKKNKIEKKSHIQQKVINDKKTAMKPFSSRSH